MKIAIIGVGHWGPNLLRNFLKHPSVEKVYCYDIDVKKTDAVRNEYPTIEAVGNYNKILNNPLINAVVLATPVTSHFSLAKQALEYNKHILVEKPLTSTPGDAEILINLAREKGLKLMVDHISIYNGAVRKIKDLIDSSEIGNIIYFDAVRTSLGLSQSDVNVVWDLAIHDLSILDYLLGKKPKAVSAVGMSHFNKLEDIAYMTLFFDNNCIAHIHVSWLSPIKVRRILIGGTKKTIVFDDSKTAEKINIHDTPTHHNLGDLHSPEYNTIEPLASVTDEFVNAIEQNLKPLTNGEVGLKIVEILAAAQKSIKNRGTIIEL